MWRLSEEIGSIFPTLLDLMDHKINYNNNNKEEINTKWTILYFIKNIKNLKSLYIFISWKYSLTPKKIGRTKYQNKWQFFKNA